MQPIDAPAITIVDIQGATYAGGAYVYGPLGAVAVVANTPFRIHFDRLLRPDTATRQSLCLQPLSKPVVNSADCADGVFLEPAYDPVRRELTYRQSPSKPPLMAGGHYRLTTYVPTEASPAGFRSFEGTPLGASVTVLFTVSTDAGPPPTYDVVSSADHFYTSPAPTCTKTCNPLCTARFGANDPREQPCEIACLAACPRSVSDILGQNGCALNYCHGPTQDGGAFEPEGLVMSSIAELHATAIGRVAHETQTGEEPRVVNDAPSRFGRAMPVLEAFSPGNSYLVYKLLANRQTRLANPFPGTPDPPPDGGDWGEAPEVRRLRTTLVVGLPMPPAGNAAYLRDGEIEWLSEWLLQGAPTPPKAQ